MPLKTVYLSLGSNLGDREQNLRRALIAIEAEHIQISARSSLYETEPQDFTQQPWFLNMAVQCETSCFPMQLLAILQRIERNLGRVHREQEIPKGPRLIDIDMLLHGDAVMEKPQLTIPHPRLLDRRFVLEPLLEIAPNLRHPVTGELLCKALKKISGQTTRRIYSTP